MRCPRGDGELIERRATGAGTIGLTYHVCLGCLGHWIDPFDANYFPSDALANEEPRKEAGSTIFSCPECKQPLERSGSDAIPQGTLAWHCPSGHGYFFPRGNLRAFRDAQSVRITYHKLWNIPLPPLRSVLLATVLLFVAGASIVTYTQLSKPQQTQTEARMVITYHDTVTTNSTVTILARTSIEMTLIAHVPELTIDREMNSADGRTHMLTIPEVLPGTYTYSFSYELSGETLVSPTYTFTSARLDDSSKRVGPSGANSD